MRVALVEWTQGGHHELYLKTAAGALAAGGHEVWILHPEPDQIYGELVAAQPKLASNLKPFVLNPASRLIGSGDARVHYVGKWRSVMRALHQIGRIDQPKVFDLVFFMFIDEFLAPLVPTTVLDSMFPYPWAGLYMQPMFRLQDTKQGHRPEFLRRDHLLRSRRFKGAAVLDETSAPWLRSRFHRPFAAVPDFGDFADPDLSAPIVKDLLAFAKGRPIIGAFGALSKRKGLLNLLRATPRMAGRDFVVAIAGKLFTSTFSPAELVEIDMATTGLADRCWYRPEPIPGDGAFNGLMSIASVVYIAYEDWVFSSGLQSIAAAFGVPSVVANTGIMAERAEAYHTGLTIDPTSPDEAAAAIQKLLTEKQPPEGFKRFTAEHGVEGFRTALREFVEGLV